MNPRLKIALVLIIALVLAAGTFIVTTRAGGFVSVQWNQIGPAPLQIDANQNFQGAGPDSGQIVDIAFDPRSNTDQIIYIAANDGGIWKSTDGGDTWYPKTDYLESLSMGAVALDAGNPSIVYAGTGNQFNNGFSKALGIYVSSDAGDSWTIAPGSSALVGKNIIRMVSPAPNTLLVGTRFGLYASTDGAASFDEVIPSGAPSQSYITDLKLDTASSATVFAAVRGLGVFESTDGGASFPTNLFTGNNGAPTANIGFISIAQSSLPNNQTIFASVQLNPYGLFRSTDGGATWANVPGANAAAAADGGCQCGYDQTIGLDPNNANNLYIGFQELWKSTNAANANPTAITFANVTANQVHWDHHALVFGQEPANPTAVFVGEDGGIAMTTNGGLLWTNINGTAGGTNALATNLFRGIDIGRGSIANNKYTYGGTQDTGSIEFKPGFIAQTWHLGIDGDGGTVAVDPCNPLHVIGQDDACYIQTSSGGSSWNTPPALPNYVGLLAFNSFQVEAFDPSCDSTVYVAGQTQTTPPANNCFTDAPATNDLYQSTNNGVSYTKITSFGSQVTTIGNVKIDPNTVWVGLNDGTLRYTTNALSGTSSTWKAPATQPAAIAGQPVTGIAIDPSNTQTVVVVYPGFSGVDPDNEPTQHVFLTTNNGGTWTDISGVSGGGAGNLPDLPLHAVVIDPATSPHTIIVASDVGVMQSGDLGQTWQILGLGMPTVEVTSLALDPTANPPLLRAGTYGRSVFELGAATTALISVNADLSFGGSCIGVAATQVVQVSNVGVAPLHIFSFSRVSGSADFTVLSGPQVPVTINPGQSLSWTIQFLPTNPGVETAVFQINSDDPFTPQKQIDASGTVNTGIVKVTGTPSFGNVCSGSNATQSIAINNVGACNLNVTSASVSCADFTLVNNAFPATVSPDSHVDETIQFTPTSDGLKSCNLVISTNDPNNPSVTVPLVGTLPTPSISVPGGGLTFPPTVIQSAGSCQSSLPVPIINSGTCGLTVTDVAVGGANPADYSLSGLGQLPATIPAGAQIDSGELSAIFKPNSITRTSTANVNVTYETDPITHATAVASLPMCGEGTNRGLRVLVTVGGVPAPKVKSIQLHRVLSADEDHGPQFVAIKRGAVLQTVTGSPPCPTFQYHAEFGAVTKPLKLKPGNFRLIVTVKVAKKFRQQILNLSLGVCDFDKLITVAF